MTVSHFIRQSHRWVAIAFTLTVVTNFLTIVLVEGPPPAWVTYSPLLPLAILLFSGLYLFVLPYTARFRQADHKQHNA